MLALLTALTMFQDLAARTTAGAAPRPNAPAPMTMSAVHAARPPVIDGRDDDEVWQAAVPISDFLEFEPNEGKAPRFKTEARVAYDSKNFYVFVRMFDDEPAKILKLLARRDVRTPSDQIKIILDSYHDRRSGYEFGVNPAGVKRDFAISNDGDEDDAWDGVWEAKTTVDSLGWTAEFKIPLSQLRYANAESHTFGFGIWRDIDRYKERASWPLYRRNAPGLSSQLGEVTNIRGLTSPRRLELSPYVVTKNITLKRGENDFTHPQRLTGGMDLKYGLSSNLTIDATVNPDFGQVEADPAVLNLGAFETFFQERRPFFIEGSGLLSFPVNCYTVRDCGSENLFYSRRIGRTPSLRDGGADPASPSATTIFGAAKVTGRTPGGLSLGVLNAMTAGEEDSDGATIEPRSNYAIVRANQDFRKGETGIGIIGTMVNRSLDQWTESSLRSTALVGGADFRHRFKQGRFQVTARLVGSRVSGGADAIAATQRSAVHYLHRPDGNLGYDPSRTSLAGSFGQIQFAKYGGGKLRFETSYQRVSAGFESNDLGFLRRADWQSHATWAQLAFNKPDLFFRRLSWNVNEWTDWTSGGMPLERAVNTNVHFELPNSWWVHAGGTAGGFGEVYCDRCSRGGPAVRTDRTFFPWGGIEGDSRWVIVPSIWLDGGRWDGGRSKSYSVSPNLQFRVSSRMNASLGMSFSKNTDDRQWYDNITDQNNVTHYTFAHLEQRTTSMSLRLNYTASPELTLQAYAEPFVSKGRYSNLRELANGRAPDYADRYRAYTAIADPGEFNVQQFRSNVVLRWEYRPGSALFLVWQQGREYNNDRYGTSTFRGDIGNLFNQHADNTFLIKASYWLNR
ncbi:MAG: carbohydrate binding family 9 domain-containing protein [Gemmatimonadales bacterium]|nr:carbohydrate binding family 9 domain-containing protein [Gemmatimonadales bacterium]